MEQIRLLREKEKEQAVVKQREYEERERELDAERAELRKVQEAQEKERQQLEDKERKARELQIKKQPKNVQNIIRAGKIILGMNKDAVKLSWGEPAMTSTERYFLEMFTSNGCTPADIYTSKMAFLPLFRISACVDEYPL